MSRGQVSRGRGLSEGGARNCSMKCSLAAGLGGLYDKMLVPLRKKLVLEGNAIIQVSGYLLPGERRQMNAVRRDGRVSVNCVQVFAYFQKIDSVEAERFKISSKKVMGRLQRIPVHLVNDGQDYDHNLE